MAVSLLQNPTALAGIVVAALVIHYVFSKVTLYFSRRKFARENGCEPIVSAIPIKDPFFGLDLLFANVAAARANKMLETTQGRFAKYGRTYRTRFAEKPAVMTMEPENIKAVLSTKFKDFQLVNRQLLLGKLAGPGIFTLDGEPWAHSRALLRPNFVKDQVADIGMFERHLEYLFGSITPGETVELQELFFRLTIDSATEFLFGESIGSLRAMGTADSKTEADFSRAFSLAQQQGLLRSRRGMIRRFYSQKEDDEACKTCHDFVDRYVAKAIAHRERRDLEKGEEKADRYVFMNELAKDTRDPLRLRSELMNILLAGRDTTASLLSNMIFMIAKTPRVWEKLQKEVEETLNGQPPTYEQLRSMKYVKYCMNESLRIHPVVPGNSRIAVHDTVLPVGGGPNQTSPVLIPKGTVVIYSPWSMHRDTKWYGADANEFRPERWETLRPGWEYLPFNGGPRICLGQQYALTEAGYTLVRLAQHFKKIESRDPGPWVEGLQLTLASKNGCKVALS